MTAIRSADRPSRAHSGQVPGTDPRLSPVRPPSDPRLSPVRPPSVPRLSPVCPPDTSATAEGRTRGGEAVR